MAAFFERWHRLQQMVGRPGEDDYRALALAVRLISSAGYGKLRAPAPLVPADVAGSIVACVVPESLVVARARNGLLVGANGSGFLHDRFVPELEAVVLTLRDGHPHAVADLAASDDPSYREAVVALIRELLEAGAVTLRPDHTDITNVPHTTPDS